MPKINRNFARTKNRYLFSETARRIADFSKSHPATEVIRMSVGDVTLPLPEPIANAMAEAARGMSEPAGFRGYGPEQGYEFLRRRIRDYYLSEDGVELDLDEIFVSDGAKCDIANFSDLFSNDNVIAAQDPTYPVYVDGNAMLGREIRYVACDESNGFLPTPEDGLEGDIFYICSPNNPTGAAYGREQLKKWVDFANANGSIILFDAAYERFVASGAPRSIYEIDGAKTCAAEFCSFSKTAGFTGVRCGYTIVPKALEFDGFSLNEMWLRRQTTKFNGASYVAQRGAEAAFSEEGLRGIDRNIRLYRENARIITETLRELGIGYSGGVDSPYVWMRIPRDMTSWGYFDWLLRNCGVAGTPGAGFGKCGEGYFRLTSFNTRENTIEAMRRLKFFCAG